MFRADKLKLKEDEKIRLKEEEKIKLKETIKVVGDPDSTETQWVPLCVDAGEKQLIKAKKEPVKGSRAVLRNIFCAGSAIFASVGHYMAALYIAGFLFTMQTGFSTDWYMQQFKLEQYLAIPMLFFGAIGFWQQFGSQGSKWSYAVTTMLLAALASFLYIHGGPLWIEVALGLAAHSMLSAVGYELRRALPINFNSPATMWSYGISCCLLATVIAITSYFAIGNMMNYQPVPYANTTFVTVALMQAILMVGVGIPSAVVSYTTRSKELAACSWMCALLQSPLLLAVSWVMLSSVTISSVAGLDPSSITRLFDYFKMTAFSTDMNATGPAIFFSSLVALVSIVAWSLIGARVGVECTKRRRTVFD